MRRFCMILIALTLAGCQRRAERPSLPPPSVTVRQPSERSLVDYKEFTGRIDARDRAEIRARVKGFLNVIHFKDGAEVKEGDLLYEIDPREYEATLAQAKANQQKEEATLRRAAEEAARGKELLVGKSISVEEYQQRSAALNAAKATVEQATAAVASASLQLEFTKIHAPISGRIGRTLVTEGNLVAFGDPTLLTTIVSLDPLYVYFDVPERDFLDYQKMIREQDAPTAEGATVPVMVGLATEEGFPHHGTIDFRNNQVDPGTGTIQIRGKLPNADRQLTPGLFARVRVPVGNAKSRLLVPEVALSSDQRGAIVLVVDPNNTVEARLVKTGTITDDGQVVIESGLHADDWIIVNGMQRARPGAKVQPKKQ